MSPPEQIVVYDIPAAKEVFRHDAKGFSDAWFSDDGQRLFAWNSSENSLAIGDLGMGSWTPSQAGLKGLFACAAYSPMRKIVATTKSAKAEANGKMKAVTLLETYDPDSGQTITRAEASESVSAMTFSPKGDILLALLANGQIGAWDTTTWHLTLFNRRPSDLPGSAVLAVDNRQISLAPDGQLLVVALLLLKGSRGEQTSVVEVWDVVKRDRRTVIETGRRIPRAAALANRRMLLFREGAPLEWIDMSTGDSIAQPFSGTN